MIRLLSFIISLFTWGAVQLVTVDYTKDIYTPIAELNNHSLSEVFEVGNIHKNIPKTITVDPNLDVIDISNNRFYINMNYDLVSRENYVGWYFVKNAFDNVILYNNDFIGIKNYIIDMTNINRNSIRWLALGSYEINVNYSYLINLTYLGIDNLTVEEMNVYYQQYLDNKDNPPHERFEVNVNDLTITDFVILMSFLFGYVIVFLVIRKVVKKK